MTSNEYYVDGSYGFMKLTLEEIKDSGLQMDEEDLNNELFLKNGLYSVQ